MILVHQQPEPRDFNRKVRQPGQAFLARNPNPDGNAWKRNRYWSGILEELRRAYNGVCAYSCHWISGSGAESVDHFVPKAVNPSLAYEWSNYRFAASKFNNRKGNRTDIVDPFRITDDWFVLVFPGLLVKPNSGLKPYLKRQVQNSIDVLKLNEAGLIDTRLDYILMYCDGDLTLRGLQKRAPFLAHELQRQGLTLRIKRMMSRRRVSKP